MRPPAAGRPSGWSCSTDLLSVSEQLSFAVPSRGYRGVLSHVVTKMKQSAGDLYLRAPPLPTVGSRDEAHAVDARRIRASRLGVKHVRRPAGKTEVLNPVVGSVAIDVIQVHARPFTMVNSPDYTVRSVDSVVDGAAAISVTVELGESLPARMSRIPPLTTSILEKLRWALSPEKLPGFFFITKDTAQCRRIVH